MIRGRYCKVSPDLEIYYEEAGSGQPIIFIPGWLGSTYVYQQQLAYFAKDYRAISYDPRSQGRSSKTLENNHYSQHGHDLKALMDTLDLKDVVLVGQSNGCLDLYAYLRAYGMSNICAIVCVDRSPKNIIEEKGDWGDTSTPSDVFTLHEPFLFDRLSISRQLFQAIVVRPLSDVELDNLVDMTLRTPTSTALSLLYDATAADHTPEVRATDGMIPALYVLPDEAGASEAGQAWLAKHAPNAEVECLRSGATPATPAGASVPRAYPASRSPSKVGMSSLVMKPPNTPSALAKPVLPGS